MYQRHCRYYCNWFDRRASDTERHTIKLVFPCGIQSGSATDFPVSDATSGSSTWISSVNLACSYLICMSQKLRVLEHEEGYPIATNCSPRFYWIKYKALKQGSFFPAKLSSFLILKRWQQEDRQPVCSKEEMQRLNQGGRAYSTRGKFRSEGDWGIMAASWLEFDLGPLKAY